jgi:mannose-6-phosphate isomerase-like protein (cupin superfamily)
VIGRGLPNRGRTAPGKRGLWMQKPINIERCFEKFTDVYSPKIVGELNGQHVKVVRLEGEKVPWHTHDDEDEMFLVVDGVLDIHERTVTVTLNPGEFYIVPRGNEHRVVPRGHVKLILFEPAGIAHTGSVRAEITKDHYDRLED